MFGMVGGFWDDGLILVQWNYFLGVESVGMCGMVFLLIKVLVKNIIMFDDMFKLVDGLKMFGNGVIILGDMQFVNKVVVDVVQLFVLNQVEMNCMVGFIDMYNCDVDVVVVQMNEQMLGCYVVMDLMQVDQFQKDWQMKN